jgi:hypothetical protein
MPAPTFASFLTPEGIIVAGGIITTLIQLIKGVFPAIDARVSGAVMAFVISAILYALVAVSTGVAGLDAGLAVFAAWLACATAAVGVYATVKHASGGGTE